MFNNNAATVLYDVVKDKRCATCRWWQGEREIRFRNMRPWKVATAGYAICQARRQAIGNNCACSRTCPAWSKWERLG